MNKRDEYDECKVMINGQSVITLTLDQGDLDIIRVTDGRRRSRSLLQWASGHGLTTRQPAIAHLQPTEIN